MSDTHTSRNRSLVAAALILLLGAIVIAWDALRTVRPPAPTVRPNGEDHLPFDLAAVRQVLHDPRMRAFVPLAPVLRPTAFGNPNPFSVLEER